ncbi:hypothetical protein VKT23_012387 [Stygiomarasmius scandens]|uniref:Uncharacterized protein n=1 Tax=Marasmiellus scandens TaxID=2682957 RepID=A0ABR1JBC5_9AGAR
MRNGTRYSVLPTPEFCFPSTVLDFVLNEGSRDHLDPATTGETPFSSPLSSVPPSPESSPRISSSLSLLSLPDLVPLDDETDHINEPTTSSKDNAQNRRNKRKSKANRKKGRQGTGGTLTAEENPPPASSKKKHVVGAPTEEALFSFEADAKAASTAYIGHREGRLFSESGYWLNDLVGPGSAFGFEEVAWDGKTATPIVDKNGTVFALLAGRPDNDVMWDHCIQAAVKELKHARRQGHFTDKQKEHRRGGFPALTAGISFGGGQTEPGNLKHNIANSKVITDLSNHWAFKRLSGFVNGEEGCSPPRS